MMGRSGRVSALVAVAILLLQLARAHTVITYPGWRGDNLYTNGTPPEKNPNSLGIDYINGTATFPFGMQFMFPCGGMPVTTNRTKWPYQGGALAFQPGWHDGHQKAFVYVNIGLTERGDLAPANYSNVAVPAFELTGPNNTQYNGTFCLPQVPMPAGMNLQIGDNVTIQLIETTQFGAALYSCVDVTLTDPSEVDEVTPQNCFNSTDLSPQLVFSTAALSGGARATPASATVYSIMAFAVVSAVYALF